MTRCDFELEALADELVAAFDEAIEIQGGILGELKALYLAAKDRDDAAMEDLMGRLGETQAALVAAERRRQDLRKRLATALRCAPAEVTLERLASCVRSETAEALRRRRDDLKLVAETVREQHLKTSTFLAEFTRVNRALLDGLLPQNGRTRTYGTDGKAAWQPAGGLFDARL